MIASESRAMQNLIVAARRRWWCQMKLWRSRHWNYVPASSMTVFRWSSMAGASDARGPKCGRYVRRHNCGTRGRVVLAFRGLGASIRHGLIGGLRFLSPLPSRQRCMTLLALCSSNVVVVAAFWAVPVHTRAASFRIAHVNGKRRSAANRPRPGATWCARARCVWVQGRPRRRNLGAGGATHAAGCDRRGHIRSL